MSVPLKRVNIQISENQHKKIIDAGLSIAGLVRDLLDDHFSESKIVLNVSQKTREFYDKIISNFGGSDEEIERYFVRSLEQYLKDKLAQGETLRQEILENLH